MIVKTPSDVEEEYQILQNFPFNSETKRMGIMVLKKSTDEILFFVKGADSAIIE